MAQRLPSGKAAPLQALAIPHSSGKRALGKLISRPDTIYCVDVKYPNQCF